MDLLSYKLRCYTRISALKKGVTKKGKWQMFIVKDKKNPRVSKCMKTGLI